MSDLKLSLQLFSMRGLGPLDAQLQAAASAGFQFVEPLENHLQDKATLIEGLRRYGLRAPTAHISLEALRTRRQEFMDVCDECGVQTVFSPHPWRTFNAQGEVAWRKLGTDLGAVAETLGEHGISFGYHNKSEGLVAKPGMRCGVDVLFEAARGSRLLWQADIGWIHSAGAGPSQWLRRYQALLASAHVKDRAPEGENVDQDGWADVGSGILIWPSLWKEAILYGAKTLVVEHDNPRDPADFAKRSFQYLNRFLTA
ncbi:sugar phosphate isomerase/epimerase [Rhizobium sp. S163]|uniref:sugar phosphate isomerase/epimerase family protein n=1 Tax=Rhizobium sp. S163 TaxID=3055039 RepID=UPI0025AA1D75|nr:sugar phosphate isomerase/epimerase [Rhizobium sp. S163]MDM9648260.1 sugar phosphate isomerase/epimerase [Rhizobium sp. S163]